MANLMPSPMENTNPDLGLPALCLSGQLIQCFEPVGVRISWPAHGLTTLRNIIGPGCDTFVRYHNLNLGGTFLWLDRLEDLSRRTGGLLGRDRFRCGFFHCLGLGLNWRFFQVLKKHWRFIFGCDLSGFFSSGFFNRFSCFDWLNPARCGFGFD